MSVKKIKGTRDYFAEEARQLNKVFETIKNISATYDFENVKLPVFEETSVFVRSVGETSDIVNKEMYTFEDKKGRSITLRPEGTAQVVRMVLENKLVELNQEQKMFYIQDMYRYERPQKGRQREFIQFGAEWFGNNGVEADIQTILFAKSVIEAFGISKYELNINAIGSKETRDEYVKVLKDYLTGKKDELSEDSVNRLETNVLRILDSKDAGDKAVVAGAPSILEFLSEEEKARFETIQDSLNKLGVTYKVNNLLVRGLDYYNDLVFEFISTDEEKLGAQSTILGGGRYDTLVGQFDSNKEVPAIGFAVGIERLMLAAADFLSTTGEKELEYTVIAISEENMQKALEATQVLRAKGNTVATMISNQKLGKKFEKAEKNNSKYVVIVGDNEELTVKELKTGEQRDVKISEL